MIETRSTIRGWRAWVLIVAGIYIGAVLMTPAQAHFASSIAHIINHAKKVFYTKSQANARFVNVGERASDSELLDGQDSSAFLGAAEKAADSELLDGVDSAELARKLKNVVTVSSSGGDFDSVQEAIDGVAADVNNPYLVIVGPGTYSGRVRLKDGIVLQGSGTHATFLIAGGAPLCQDAFVVKSGSGTLVSDLTIANQGGATCSVGVLTLSGSSGSDVFRGVNISAAEGTATSVGIRNEGSVVLEEASVLAVAPFSEPGAVAIGVDQPAILSSLLARQSSISAISDGDASYGIRDSDSRSTLEHSSVRASGTADPRVGIFGVSGTGQVIAEHSTVDAATNTISTPAGYQVQVAFSRLKGGAVTAPGVQCAAVVDEGMMFSASTCP